MPGKNIVTPQVLTGRRSRLEEGPWAVSAAETPHDPSSYSLYIKSESLILSLGFLYPLSVLSLSDMYRAFTLGTAPGYRRLIGVQFWRSQTIA